MPWLLVFLGGGAGSLCRYALAIALPPVNLNEGDFPWATLVANATACLLLGAGLALVSREALPREYALLLLTGFCGGFSTFSTFSAELFSLYEAGEYGVVIGYLLGSLGVGVIAVWLGLAVLR